MNGNQSSDDSDDDSDVEKKVTPPAQTLVPTTQTSQPLPNQVQKQTLAKQAESSDSDSDSDDEDNNTQKSVKPSVVSSTTTSPVIPPTVKLTVEEPESSDSEEEDTATKTSQVASKAQAPNGTGKPSQNPQTVLEPKQAPTKKAPDLDVPKTNKKNKGDQKNVPFQRVKPELSDLLDKRMFASQRNANSEWAEKADSTLKKVKGKGFRHEKTKKKRGTYRGGALELGVKSIKFQD